MKSSRLPKIDWKSMMRRLIAAAIVQFRKQKCLGENSVLKGTGKSPEDLAKDAITEFLRIHDKYSFQTEEECFRFMSKILHNDFRDLIKKQSHAITDLIDDESNGVYQKLTETPASDSDFVNADAALLAHELYPYAQGEQELIDLIDAVVRFNRDKREDIADILGIEPKEVSKLWERLKYRVVCGQKKIQPARMKV